MTDSVPKKMIDLPNEVSQNLSEEDKASLERLRKFRDMHNQIPPEEREPITNPEKYSFPVGMDDEGNLNIAEE